MRLVILNGKSLFSIIAEGYARTIQFDYEGGTDPSPDALKLGTWAHPNTGNTLIGGINLHYLRGMLAGSPELADRWERYIRSILKYRHLRRRYWTGRRLLPEIFGGEGYRGIYRTWDIDKMRMKGRGTLKFITPKQYLDMGEPEKAAKLQAVQDYEKETAAQEKERKKKAKEQGVPIKRVPWRDRMPDEPEPEERPAAEVPPPEETEPETRTVAQRAQDDVEAKQTKAFMARLDDKVRKYLEKGAVEEPEVPEEPEDFPEEEEEWEEEEFTPFGEVEEWEEDEDEDEEEEK
jgi:hypothetical protein